jgi:methylamine--corrinoid protein Co-methyltransferase
VIELIEVAERARTGLRLEEKKWNLTLFRKMQELIKEYDLSSRGVEEFINTDDRFADDAFEAALEFIVDVGVYCISTNRVIRFEEEEVRKAVREAPDQILMGEGRDARVFKQGTVDGSKPININSGHHAPFTEDLGPLVAKNFAQIPRTDFIEGFNFPIVDGRDVYDQPLEAYAAIREVAWMREGVRKAGRPGLAIVLYPITTRASSLIAPMNPKLGLRPTDGLLMSTLPDVKVEYDHITTAIVFSNYGYFGVNGSFGMAGGFCGGPEGAMIEGIVRPIIGYMMYGDSLHYTGVEHLAYVMGERIVLHPLNWARSVVYQALCRNTNMIYMEWNITCSGLCTETSLLENALRSVEATVNGAALYAPRVSRARMNAGQTPVEPEFMIEVSDATVKANLKREEAGKILKQIADRLKDRSPEKGKTIQECYDLVKHKPSNEYQEIYHKVKKDLVDLGLEFQYT